MKPLLKAWFVFALALGTLQRDAAAFWRLQYEDADVVERSELIAIGRLQPDSLQLISYSDKDCRFAWWENTAVLIIDEVLKGECRETRIPIVIHAGLNPAPGGMWKHPGGTQHKATPMSDASWPKDSIPIVDTGSRTLGLVPTVDAAQNNLWFLRRLGDRGFQVDPKANFGIVDPEDVQPLKLKNYLQCYLSDAPASCVREQIQRLPEISSRGNLYLDRQELQRIGAIEDPIARIEQALPYWKERKFGRVVMDAQKILVDAGIAAGPYLMSIYQDSARPELRERVIEVWGRLRYPGCVDLLSEQLTANDKFWGDQQLEKDWWNSDSALNKLRRDRYSEDHNAVIALGKIGDPRAEKAIRVTRERWKQINFDNPQIIEACESALQQFEKAAEQEGQR